ncbi:DNA repair protein RecN [Actinomyces graevenitzii F0530]|uniref:DNA repair protein RecN n=1 Tax=Actinomyces graevenitzii F0530 TaxID=1321817 RepID=U1RQJ0_9ACTO|nr:DNA repair protein RecN [Actinomyces graevenitzii]ERH20707.1 DNA repair protein RecN [Actinomyces graevenitzii F0530]
MIETISIENLGVIAQAELPLGPGLTALTGETGAGKTMVLTSLKLLLGSKADPAIVRAGTQRCVVEGAFALEEDAKCIQIAQEAGCEIEDDLLLASRVVPATGRSRAHLGGRAVPASVLGQVGSRLVSIHGQADQLRLRTAAAQRRALDAVGGSEHEQLCRQYSSCYRAWNQARQDLETWREQALAREGEIAGLRHALEQLEALDPKPGEDQALAEEASRLENLDLLRSGAAEAANAISGDELNDDVANVIALVSVARRSLENAADHDSRLACLMPRLNEVAALTSDLAMELTDYLADLDADPDRLAWVHERREQLRRGCLEIGGLGQVFANVDELLAFGQHSAARLAQLDGPLDREAELAAEVERTGKELKTVAKRLSQARTKLAKLLSQQVSAELEGLMMRGAKLQVRLNPLEQPGPTGMEEVELLLRAHPGAAALPLEKGASGGELSRIMLALEVVLAQHTATKRHTFVFDEIDAGVGGRAAVEIGRRLAALACHHQVIVVTHLAQVAAWAQTQLVVVKQVGQASNEATTTAVETVEGPERVRELARMLSGQSDSQTALRHAEELLEQANMAQSKL